MCHKMSLKDTILLPDFGIILTVVKKKGVTGKPNMGLAFANI